MWKIVGSSHDGVKTKIKKIAFARIIKEQQQNWTTQNQNKVLEWSDMSTRGLFVQTKGTSSNVTCSRHDLVEILPNWR